jgi:hypothetical protein
MLASTTEHGMHTGLNYGAWNAYWLQLLSMECMPAFTNVHKSAQAVRCTLPCVALMPQLLNAHKQAHCMSDAHRMSAAH